MGRAPFAGMRGGTGGLGRLGVFVSRKAVRRAVRPARNHLRSGPSAGSWRRARRTRIESKSWLGAGRRAAPLERRVTVGPGPGRGPRGGRIDRLPLHGSRRNGGGGRWPAAFVWSGAPEDLEGGAFEAGWLVRRRRRAGKATVFPERGPFSAGGPGTSGAVRSQTPGGPRCGDMGVRVCRRTPRATRSHRGWESASTPRWGGGKRRKAAAGRGTPPNWSGPAYCQRPGPGGVPLEPSQKLAVVSGGPHQVQGRGTRFNRRGLQPA